MKQRISFFIFVIIISLIHSILYADSSDNFLHHIKDKERKPSFKNYHFGYLKGIEVKITPEKTEIPTGGMATFTVTLTNRNKFPVSINYSNGREWDMIIYYKDFPIYRWSNGYTWEESRHSIGLMPGESRSQIFTWVAVNRIGVPLSQGIYECAGVVTSSPKMIVSDPVKFRLTPPSVVAKKLIITKLNQCFDIDLPRFSDNNELTWEIVYANNDNRISMTSKTIKKDSITITFMPKRIGHVEFDLYAYPSILNNTVSLERRSYRIEVK